MFEEGRAALLIDDNRLDQLNTRSLLLGSNAGYERLEWIDRWPGAEIALRNGPFELFIVDINLGAESGLDVIRDLRAAGVLAPIIAFTGRDDPDVDRACTEAGASDFLVKDRVDRDTFERAVRYAERQADVHRELDRLNAALERRATAENDQARLMRFAIEQSTDGIVLTKAGTTLADHAIVYVNAALCRLLDRRAGDLLGDDVAALIVDDGATVRIDEAMSRQVAFRGTTALRSATSSVPIDLHATPLRSSDDDVTHYVWTCRRELALSTDPRTAPGRLEAIGQVAIGFAHALNDRLTTVIGNLDLLASRSVDDRVQKPAKRALRAAEELVAQSRLLVAIAADDDIATWQPVQADALLARVATILQDVDQAKRNAHVHPGAASSWPIAAHPIRLAFALVSLASRMRAARFDRAVGLSARNVPGTSDDPQDRVALSVLVDDVDCADVDVDVSLGDALARDVGSQPIVASDGRGGVVATLLLPRAPGP